MNFYPRSPCGERPRSAGPWQGECKISIHALLAESDAQIPKKSFGPVDFYPRSPCGERRNEVMAMVYATVISIHALLAESDARIIDPTYGQEVFLSTLSLRRATFRPGDR